MPPPAADRKALIELRGLLEQMVVAERDDTAFRNECLVSLNRIHIALCGWGIKGQSDWYLRLLLNCPPGQNTLYVQSTLADAGENAARTWASRSCPPCRA